MGQIQGDHVPVTHIQTAGSSLSTAILFVFEVADRDQLDQSKSSLGWICHGGLSVVVFMGRSNEYSGRARISDSMSKPDQGLNRALRKCVSPSPDRD